VRNAFSLRILVIALFAGAFAGAPGCKKETNSASSGGASNSASSAPKNRKVFKVPAGQTPKLAFVTNNASDFWKIAQAGVQKFTSETGQQVDIKIPSQATVAEQNQILEDLLSQGYNGIAISVIAPDEQTRQINKACAQTNVICQDSDAANSNRLLYIGTNNYEAGKVLGQQIVKLLPNGGKMAVFVGTFSADNARQRLKGIEDAIAGHNIQVVAKKEDNKDPGKARSNVEDVINDPGLGVNLLTGLWSYNGPAIASAVEASGRKGKIQVAVFDEDDGTLDGIQNGTVACTVVQKPFEFGYQSCKILADLAKNGESALPASPFIDTGVTVINADNVKDFRQKLAEMKGGK
jgi:ribose transport system substrate-binding protein